MVAILLGHIVIVMLAVKTEALGVVYPSAVLLMPEEHQDAEAYQISCRARTVAAEQRCWSPVRKIEITHWCNTNENLSRLQQQHTHTHTSAHMRGNVRLVGRQSTVMWKSKNKLK